MAVLSEDQVAEALAGLDGWEVAGDSITKTFTQADFAASVALVNRMAPVAEDMNHHPDLWISWGTVTVSLSTHSAGGLTELDFRLARRIDAIA